MSSEESSQETKQGSQVSREWEPSKHDDNASPRTQAFRESPPSSQQYSAWNKDQRSAYRQEVAKDGRRKFETEVQILAMSNRELIEERHELKRDRDWYRAGYLREIQHRYRPQPPVTPLSDAHVRTERVAAIRVGERRDSRETPSATSSQRTTQEPDP